MTLFAIKAALSSELLLSNLISIFSLVAASINIRAICPAPIIPTVGKCERLVMKKS
jgi:hypothetical protein